MPKDDVWIDDVRSGRVQEAISYLRDELRTPRMYPSNHYSLAQSTCGREITDQPLRTSTGKYKPATDQRTRLLGWLELLLGAWETKSWQSSIGEREQLRDMLTQEQTLVPSFCCTLHPY